MFILDDNNFLSSSVNTYISWYATHSGWQSFTSLSTNGSLSLLQEILSKENLECIPCFCAAGLLPAATKLWPRLCFYSCLWFCTQGGLPQCMLGYQPPPEGGTRQKEAPPLEGGTPQEGGTTQKEAPSQKEAPPKGDPPGKEAPPGRRHPQKETPLGRRHPPPEGGIPLGRRPPSPAYSQWAAGTHPTGMHFVLLLRLLKRRNILHSIMVTLILNAALKK